MSKKTRGPNFSSNEKEILIHLVTKYKDVVENKKTDATTTAVKNEGWRKLTEEFNSLSTFSVRNSEQLKTCWDNIKRNTRKDKAAMKKEIILTGGGRPNLPPPGPFQGQVEILLGPTLDGLDNPFDSDAQYSDQNVICEKSMLTDCDIQVIENEPADQLGVSESREDDCKIPPVSENEPASPSGISKSREDECLMVLPEDHKKKMWNGWSPAALKTKVADSLVTSKKTSSPWLHRRRPKASVHDKLLQTKLELVELMKKNAESEATINHLILKEKLKQEKIKTEVLELQLKQAQQKNY